MNSFRQSARVSAPHVPLYLMGYRGLRLHGLASGAQAIQAGSAAAGQITTSLLTSSAASAGGAGGATGVAAFAGPIGVGIAVVGSIIAGLWAAHAARAKGAKNENTAVNSALQAFDASMRAIFDAANSNDPSKYIDAQTAIAACWQTLHSYWAAPGIATSGQQPGTSDESNHGTNCAAVRAKATPCDKVCTAACCVGCVDLEPSVQNAIAVFQQGGGTATIRKVFPSKYGVVQRNSYTLTYAPNPPSEDALAAAFGGSTSGGSGGGSSFPLLPLLGLGLAFLAFH